MVPRSFCIIQFTYIVCLEPTDKQKTSTTMAQIVFVSHAKDLIRNTVLWQVYHLLALQAATPHSFWLQGRRIMCNTPQQMVFTARNRPTTFKALLSIQGRQVGVLCCVPQLTTLLNGINMLAGEGAEIIVCGLQSANELFEQFVRGGLQRIGHEYMDTINLQGRIPNNVLIDPNALRDGLLFNDVVQDIINCIIHLIN